MALKSRVARLERRGGAGLCACRIEGVVVVEPGAPDPPCPPWLDPADWAGRLRITRCSEGRLAGALRPGEYLPGMDEDERRYVDELAQAFADFARGYAPKAPSGTGA